MAVKRLSGYALTVPDAEEGRRFYTTFGLVAHESGEAIRLRCPGLDHDQIRLVEGKRKRLNHITFSSDEAGLNDVRRRMAAHGAAEAAEPHPEFGGGLWLRDPDGNAVNVQVVPEQPARSAPEIILNTPGHYRRIGERSCPAKAPVEPNRLGHVMLHTPRLEEMIRFYSDVLGLRLSDRCGSINAFMHSPLGGDHHIVGFANDERPGFHHASFEVASIDAIGMGAQTVLEAGYRDGWGLGRHVIGSNFFHYLRDPWHSLAEYYCDMDQIPADGSWCARDYPPEDAHYRWGPRPPGDFGANFEQPD